MEAWHVGNVISKTAMWMLVGVAGCGPVAAPPLGGSTSGTTEAGDATGADPSASAEGGMSGGPGPMTTGAGVDSGTGVDTGTAEDDAGSTYLIVPDMFTPDFCDVWAQDCPPDEKCMPWSGDGSGSWNSARCTPVAADPREVGEPCTVVDSPTSGIDDCVPGAMCWGVDPETNMGECVSLCQGSEENPLCEAACDTCPIGADTVLILCLPQCDPIAQDCADGHTCQPYASVFVCLPDASGEQGLIGDPCGYINACDAGNFCAGPEVVPGCEGPDGCCAPFCDAAVADTCDALLPGTTCVPWYEDGQQPATCIGTSIIGFCAVTP